MTRTHLLIPAIALLFAACGGQQAPAPEAASEKPTPADNSRTSLDWAGTYKGTLPCADCEGITTWLTINADGSYELHTQYQGKGDVTVFLRDGNFSWMDDGNHIVLEGIQDAPNIYQVGENHLRQRDMEGKPITGDMADRYVLHKVEQAATKADAMTAPALLGTYWKLVEIMGKPVTHDERRVPAHMVLQTEEKRVAGNAGCNSFFATYELDETKGSLRFSKAGSTMMACPDMSVEDAFHQALEQVDNYTIGQDGRLSLNKAKMAPLMRFEAVDM